MSKAVLIMDMPSSCEECILRNEGACFPVSKENSICGVYYTMKEGRKPDWCPLRELPKKIGIEEAIRMPRNGCVSDVINSYNACIDELLKEE